MSPVMESPMRRSRTTIQKAFETTAKETSASTPTPSSPYRHNNWTVTQLKDELRHRHLPTAGKKADLIVRLESADSPTK
jgi:hypothetical protein